MAQRLGVIGASGTDGVIGTTGTGTTGTGTTGTGGTGTGGTGGTGGSGVAGGVPSPGTSGGTTSGGGSGGTTAASVPATAPLLVSTADAALPGALTLGADAPLVLTTGGGERLLSVPKATATTDGYLAAADFAAFSSVAAPTLPTLAVSDGTTTATGVTELLFTGASVAVSGSEAQVTIAPGAVSPATASAFGTVKTDITESGGSVVYTKTTTDTLLAGKISVGAALSESEVTGLVSDLAGKITAGTAFPESEITNLVSDLAGKLATGGSITEAQVISLTSDLAGKLAVGAALPESEITGLVADLAARLVLAGAAPTTGQVPTWNGTAWTPATPSATSFASVIAPISVTFDHADYSGATMLPTWRANVTANPAGGASEYFGWEFSEDDATWTAEVFGGYTYQGPPLTSGSQYARCRAYPLVAAGVTPTPSGWVASSAQAYALNPAKKTWPCQIFLNSSPDSSPETANRVRVPEGTGAAAATWIPVTAELVLEAASATPFTVQLYYSTAVPFGAGTALLSSPLTISGTGTYSLATTAFALASLATGGHIAAQVTSAGAGTTALAHVALTCREE